MRILDSNQIAYRVKTYECDEFVDGIHVADLNGDPYDQSFKTLVTVGKTGAYYVFVIPIDKAPIETLSMFFEFMSISNCAIFLK